jgi:hypothetical protein
VILHMLLLPEVQKGGGSLPVLVGQGVGKWSWKVLVS